MYAILTESHYEEHFCEIILIFEPRGDGSGDFVSVHINCSLA